MQYENPFYFTAVRNIDIRSWSPSSGSGQIAIRFWTKERVYHILLGEV